MNARDIALDRYPEAFHLLENYAGWLGSAGVERGLIGPREVDKLWDRHILNCTAVADPELELIPTAATVIDVGSGAGLPGLVWAITRPDLTLTLVDTKQRRVAFLNEVATDLGLSGWVTAMHARGQDVAGTVSAHIVTARALAPLERLIPWLAPLVAPGGEILAMKGSSVSDEIRDAAPAIAQCGAKSVEVVECGAWLPEPTFVARIADLGT